MTTIALHRAAERELREAGILNIAPHTTTYTRQHSVDIEINLADYLIMALEQLALECRDALHHHPGDGTTPNGWWEELGDAVDMRDNPDSYADTARGREAVEDEGWDRARKAIDGLRPFLPPITSLNVRVPVEAVPALLDRIAAAADGGAE